MSRLGIAIRLMLYLPAVWFAEAVAGWALWLSGRKAFVDIEIYAVERVAHQVRTAQGSALGVLGDFFGFAPDYTSGAASINGDDAMELFGSGVVIDVFGDI